MCTHAHPQSGVYKITHLPTGLVYVGSTRGCLTCRWQVHQSKLRLGTHENAPLGRVWQAGGAAPDFIFTVLERCPAGQCLFWEQFWLDALHAANPAAGFNRNPRAGTSKGVKRSPETRERLRAVHRGRVPSETTRRGASALSPWHKISPAQAAEIRRLYGDPRQSRAERLRQGGLSAPLLAARFHVVTNTIYDVVRRRSWKYEKGHSHG